MTCFSDDRRFYSRMRAAGWAGVRGLPMVRFRLDTLMVMAGYFNCKVLFDSKGHVDQAA